MKLSNALHTALVVFISVLLSFGVASRVQAASEVYGHTQSGSIIYQSSENGSDFDIVTFDNFTLSQATDITEIHWIGGYLNNSGPVQDFKVEIYPTSIANEPDLIAGPVRSYDFGSGIGNAGESSVGGGRYAYSLALSTPFHAEANTKYWIKIAALQGSLEGWGLASSASNDLTRFYGERNCPTCEQWHKVAATNGDTVFSLFAADPPVSVPEFGLIAGILALAGSAGSFVFARRKNR